MISTLFRVVIGVLAISSSAIAVGPGAVALGTAGNYAILAEAGISSVPLSVITGDIAVSPAAATSITGFSLTLSSDGTYSLSAQVTGKVYAASYASPTPATLTTAVGDLVTAYNNAGPAILTPPDYSPTTGELGGLTLTGGIYDYSGAVTITTSVTLSGSSTDTWVFQVGAASTLTQSGSTSVFLSGGALAKNVFWRVPGAVVIGDGATFQGILLGAAAVTLDTGATLNGRILSQTAVALQKATVSS
jgi:hypothetical protein